MIGVGIPDDEAGELIKEVVVLHKGQNTPSEEILACMNGKLAGYKHLHFIEFLDAIPKTASGKLLRRELRDRELNRFSQTD